MQSQQSGMLTAWKGRTLRLLLPWSPASCFQAGLGMHRDCSRESSGASQFPLNTNGKRFEIRYFKNNAYSLQSIKSIQTAAWTNSTYSTSEMPTTGVTPPPLLQHAAFQLWLDCVKQQSLSWITDLKPADAGENKSNLEQKPSIWEAEKSA